MDCLFNETLDLSQDDIQRTLSANLSHESAFHTGHVGGADVGCGGGNGGQSGGEMRPRPIEVGSTSACDDDLLVNLDAFDMLTEFSDLDCRDTIDSLISIQADMTQPNVMDVSGVHKDPHARKMLSPTSAAVSSNALAQPVLTEITDFSPEWSPTEVCIQWIQFSSSIHFKM